MAFVDRILEPPRYGYARNGEFYRPTGAELRREFFYRANVFRDRRNWMTFLGWSILALMAASFAVFIGFFFSWKAFVAGWVYGRIVLSPHATVYLHRYCSHRAYEMRGTWVVFLVKNLVIKVVPEEIYAISHIVHHHLADRPGDPYTPRGGWWYCFLADAVHNNIRRDLSPEEYAKVSRLLSHALFHRNSYAQYRKWGTVSHPASTVAMFALNWLFHGSLLYAFGGWSWVTGIFGLTLSWGVGIRLFNWKGHGKGEDRRRKGIDFNWDDLSINKPLPGYFAGEWHNNHHLYPNSARAGFLPHQFDVAWFYIRSMHRLGLVTKYKDNTRDFLAQYAPHLLPAPRREG